MKTVLLFFTLTLFCPVPSVLYAEPQSGKIEEQPETTPVVRVFLDPGHGGEELGARSPEMILEKNINLKIVGAVAKRLSKNIMIDVVQSRKDDKNVNVETRIEMANATGSELFVSVHSAGGSRPVTRSGGIYVIKQVEEKKNDTLWKNQNAKYIKESDELARIMSEYMEGVTEKKYEIFRSGNLFLGGLMMPGIIIEAVDLANPEEKSMIDDEKYIREISSAIASAIQSYLIKNKGL